MMTKLPTSTSPQPPHSTCSTACSSFLCLGKGQRHAHFTPMRAVNTNTLLICAYPVISHYHYEQFKAIFTLLTKVILHLLAENWFYGDPCSLAMSRLIIVITLIVIKKNFITNSMSETHAGLPCAFTHSH